MPPHVKTSLAPGSRVVTDYLQQTGLLAPLEQLGFHVVGYGCTTCIGNSGPLPEPVANAIAEGNLVAAAVLSGNRNFEGRVNPLVKANYLASPPLVVAYALAGTVDLDLSTDPLGHDPAGQPVYLRDVWPSRAAVEAAMEESILPELFVQRYEEAIRSNEMWNAIRVTDSDLYPWDPESTYIQEPPFLTDITADSEPDHAYPRCPGPGTVGRFRDHRSHFPRGFDRPEQPCGTLSHPTGCVAGGFQQLRFPPRQRSRHGAGHVRQHSHPQSVGARNRRRLDAALARWRGHDHLRSRGEIPSGRRSAGGPGGSRVWDGQQSGLGGQGHVSAGRACRYCRQFRAHPSQQPGRHGYPASGIRARRRPGLRWASPAKRSSTFP